MKKDNLTEIARGHDFLRGNFIRYTSSNGIEITEYIRGFWMIENDYYKLEGDKFIKLEKPKYKKLLFNSVTFPNVNRIFC